MANLANADFYYGAVLSHLLTSNKEHNPALFEDSDEPRVFNIIAGKHEYVLHTHKSEGKRDVKGDAISWAFTLSDKTVQELQDNHLESKGVFKESAKSIGMTIRKYSNKNDYLLFIDKRIENAIPVKQNLSLDY